MKKKKIILTILLFLPTLFISFVLIYTYARIILTFPKTNIFNAHGTATSVKPKEEKTDNIFLENNKEKSSLEKYFTVVADLLGVTDNMSFYYRDLNQQLDITFDADRSWIPASVIKAFLVPVAFKQRQLGLINFDQRLIIKKENVVPTELEEYDFPPLREGTRATIRELIDAMIIQSDNTAYNTLLDILDRRNISATLKEIGLTDTVVGEKINLDDDQYQKDLQALGRQPNKTTAKDFATLFIMLYNNTLPNSDEILSIFKKQQVNYMIPVLLPENTVIAHKTGELPPYYHDGGIIYKPREPFVLTVFTNHGDPSVVSQLAKAAYFKNVGILNSFLKNSSTTSTVGFKSHVIKKFALENIENNVLGIKIKKNYIHLTAADFGITTQDLSIDREDSETVPFAHITPENIFYPLKRLWEDWEIHHARTNQQKTDIYLHHALNRVAEIKTELKNDNITDISYLLNECNKDLQEAIMIIKNTEVPDIEIIYVKQINDLLYATLGANTKYIKEGEIPQFIDKVYSFYQDNKTKIIDLVKNQGIENPFFYEPFIGKIKEKNNDTLIISLQNGSSKTVHIFDTTQVRGFHKTSMETTHSFTPGSRVAVVGEYTDNGEIIPLFILKDLPDNFPQKVEGMIIEINTDQNTMKVQDASGAIHTVFIDDSTILKARDTDVTIGGITTGSQVVAFGEFVKETSQLHATTVTIAANGSGRNEQIEIITTPASAR